MQLRTFVSVLAFASAELNVSASFRSVPIVLPPVGPPCTLKARGTYTVQPVHQWPPMSFDDWTPVEYYAPYGYVYRSVVDGREFVFDTTATRPVIREASVGVEAQVQPTFEVTFSSTEAPELPPHKHMTHLRGVFETITTLPAYFIKDAFVQGRGLIFGKDKKFFDVERLFGDIFNRDCRITRACQHAADTWIEYVRVAKEKAAEITAQFHFNGEKFQFDDELLNSVGGSLVQKIENLRKTLVSEVETLPNVVDKSSVVQLLLTPLEYIQIELESKEGHFGEEQLYTKGVDMINQGGQKLESLISGAVEHLSHFPKMIVGDLAQIERRTETITPVAFPFAIGTNATLGTNLMAQALPISWLKPILAETGIF